MIISWPIVFSSCTNDFCAIGLTIGSTPGFVVTGAPQTADQWPSFMKSNAISRYSVRKRRRKVIRQFQTSDHIEIVFISRLEFRQIGKLFDAIL